jgi:C_GCAxxG_C_C family probable redox protein
VNTVSVEQTAQRARALMESSSFCCSESVLLAIAENRGVESDTVPQIATGFCGGMSHTCGPCGAVTGAMMGLGLINGRSQPNMDRAANMAAVQRFLSAFKEQFGSINCQELTQCDLGTPEGQAKFRAENRRARCLDYVQVATQLALTAINEP